jgi:hypothetical protein
MADMTAMTATVITNSNKVKPVSVRTVHPLLCKELLGLFLGRDLRCINPG